MLCQEKNGRPIMAKLSFLGKTTITLVSSRVVGGG